MLKLEQILNKLNPKERTYIQRLIEIDELTHIFNRRYFNKKLREEFQRVKFSKKGLSLLLLDIDNFKDYQDKHKEGHVAGDKILRSITSLLSKQIRDYDFICRYGGEELAIVCPDSTLIEGKTIAERLRRIVSPRFPVTISLGVSNYPENSSTISELILNADKGLYNAKKSGKNQVGVFYTNSPV